MKYEMVAGLTTVLATAACAWNVCAVEAWIIDTQDAWRTGVVASSHLDIKGGMAVSTARRATFRSTLRTFDRKRSARSLVIDQSPVWENWEPIDNIGPGCVYDAPVLLSLGPWNDWFSARHNRPAEAEAWDASKGFFVAQPAHLEGFRHSAVDHSVAKSVPGAGRTEAELWRLSYVAESRHGPLGASPAGDRSQLRLGDDSRIRNASQPILDKVILCFNK